MKILLTECYSATNIGDLELVTRSLQITSEIYPNSQIECVASDPDSFINIITTTSFSGPIFDRLKMIRGSLGVKLLGMTHAIATIGIFTILSFLPQKLARALVKLHIKFGLANSTAIKYLNAQRIVGVGGGYLGDKYAKMTTLTVWTWWWAGKMGCAVETMPMSVEVTTPFLSKFLSVFGRNVVWRVRDQASVRALANCGIQSELVPDLAFLNAEIIQNAPSLRNGLLVALVGGDYLSEAEQKTLYGQVAENIARYFPHAEVTLLSMHRSMGGTRVGGDVEASLKMAALLADKGIRHQVVNAATYSEVCNFCLNVEYVISARMHAGIAALCAGAKVGFLAYEEKHTALMSDMGLKDFAINIRCEDSIVRGLFERLVKANTAQFNEKTKIYLNALLLWVKNRTMKS